jgi:succinate-acetate transporter protein
MQNQTTTVHPTESFNGESQDDAHLVTVQPVAERRGPVDTRGIGRINTAPLCLVAFAVVTFMFSFVNAGGLSHGVLPIVISTGIFFGGVTQLVGGLIQIGSGDTLSGAMFSTFASLWLLLAVYLEWFSKAVPIDQRGPAIALLFYTFAAVAAMFLLVSLRTNIATLFTLGTLVVTLVVLAVGSDGNYSVMVRIGGGKGSFLLSRLCFLARQDSARTPTDEPSFRSDSWGPK